MQGASVIPAREEFRLSSSSVRKEEWILQHHRMAARYLGQLTDADRFGRLRIGCNGTKVLDLPTSIMRAGHVFIFDIDELRRGLSVPGEFMHLPTCHMQLCMHAEGKPSVFAMINFLRATLGLMISVD